ncbi:fungal-specific transcription factor domain-containing protein [Lasiosphaeria ovina]|uniref:Fungal-specific transcription factor domain-containing protein n=1 Tax=Lasiosphaeria ovina TaxID=92902 RepID=A0AAE0KF45_9PEZI|nr:fungal-specific transcription factor domain-containing protein [Lasiosphaeria ovina]
MEVVPQLNRRKACDLCFTKKIKCDMMKPVCSNCRIYKSECRTTAIRRRAGVSRKPAVSLDPSDASHPGLGGATAAPDNTLSVHVPTATASSGPQLDPGLESRLARIEQQLQQVLSVASSAVNRANELEARTAGHHAPWPNPMPADPGKNTLSSVFDDNDGDGGGGGDHVSPEALNNHDHVVRTPIPKLPPLEELQPIVDSYFAYFNHAIPIFSQPEFARLLAGWYSAPSRRSRAAWAAINIVLALSSSIPLVPRQQVYYDDDPKTVYYMSNAQSVLAELVTRDEDLLGLQVLLGLVFLLQGSKDPRSASVLIGAAVRLTHRLRLQSRDNIEENYTAEEGLHRCRVFWIAYLLDKEISIRHHTPSVQVDADIDLDLPSRHPPDGVSDIYTADGRVRVNYLRLRVQLAHIQGRTYDLLYSTRSTRISPQERQSRVVRLATQLEKWRRSIPAEMQLGSVDRHLDRFALIHMATLLWSYHASLATIHGVWSHNAHWMKRISNYSQTVIRDSEIDGRKCCYHQHPPLPAAWKRLLGASRECLALANKMPQSDCNVWANTCSLFSAMIIIMSNMYEFPDSDPLANDRDLVQYALGIFHKIKDISELVPLKKLHVVVVELDRASSAAVEMSERKRVSVIWGIRRPRACYHPLTPISWLSIRLAATMVRLAAIGRMFP